MSDQRTKKIALYLKYIAHVMDDDAGVGLQPIFSAEEMAEVRLQVGVLQAQIAMTVDRLGGMVEGEPTCEALQRNCQAQRISSRRNAILPSDRETLATLMTQNAFQLPGAVPGHNGSRPVRRAQLVCRHEEALLRILNLTPLGQDHSGQPDASTLCSFEHSVDASGQSSVDPAGSAFCAPRLQSEDFSVWLLAITSL